MNNIYSVISGYRDGVQIYFPGTEVLISTFIEKTYDITEYRRGQGCWQCDQTHLMFSLICSSHPRQPGQSMHVALSLIYEGQGIPN